MQVRWPHGDDYMEVLLSGHVSPCVRYLYLGWHVAMLVGEGIKGKSISLGGGFVGNVGFLVTYVTVYLAIGWVWLRHGQ